MNFSCTEEERVSNPSCRKSRNAGGPQYYHYIMNNIYDENMPRPKFMELHKVYCAVSGSPITDINRKLTVQMNHENGGTVCGEYHMCCTPCFCDIQRFAQVHTKEMVFDEGTREVHTLTIKDPCVNPIPPSVTSFKCSKGCFDADGNHLKDAGKACYTENAERLPGGRIIIGVIQNGRECTEDDIHGVKENKHKFCSKRMRASSDELLNMGGMSNIFTELACNNDGCPNDPYYN